MSPTSSRRPLAPQGRSGLAAWRRVQVATAGLLLLTTGVAGGMVLERYVVGPPHESPGTFADLEAAADVIDQNYYYLPTDPAQRQSVHTRMEDGAITGALGTLGDGYTRYLSADDAATSNEDLKGEYGGVGVDIVVDEGLVVISYVVPNSPAAEAGIQRGDVIESIDGTQLKDPDAGAIVRLLRGAVGDKRRLETVRPSDSHISDVTLTLREIVVPQVTWSVIPRTTIGLIRITIFGDQTLPNLDQALADFASKGITGIILDLRSNGGGWVTAAQGTLGRFLPTSAGPALYEDTTPGPGGEAPLPIVADEGVEPSGLPLVVLVDGGTASAAEIVAGSLKDYDRALVIGEHTFGKGSVQRIFDFSDGSSMRVTVAEWFTPSHGRIQEHGIQPNLEIGTGKPTSTDDPVVSAAVHVIEGGRWRPSSVATPIAPASPPVPS